MPPCFSPDSKSQQEISGCPNDFRYRRWRPARSFLKGGTPFRQLHPAYPSTGGRWRRVRFSEEFPTSQLRMCILTAQPDFDSAASHRRDKSPPLQASQTYSRNPSNITTPLHTVNRLGAHLTFKVIRLRRFLLGSRIPCGSNRDEPATHGNFGRGSTLA